MYFKKQTDKKGVRICLFKEALYTKFLIAQLFLLLIIIFSSKTGHHFLITCEAKELIIDNISSDITLENDFTNKPIFINKSIIMENILKEKEEIVLTDEEIDLIALVTMAEAEGECEYGQRLVIDTVLNRLEHEKFPDTVSEVIYQPNQFTSMWGERVKKCYVKDEIVKLVKEELEERSNDEVMFFRNKHYGKYGTPLFQIGGHYFSSYS